MRYKVLKKFFYDKALEYQEGETFVVDGDDYRKGSTDFLSLNGFIEEIKDVPWKPEEGDTVHYLVTTGDVTETIWTGGTNIDDCGLGRAYSLGFVRQSKQELVQFRDWFKAFKVLRDDTKGFKADLSNQDELKWVVGWDLTSYKLDVISTRGWASALLRFRKDADAWESIRNHEKEWKIFLGVK